MKKKVTAIVPPPGYKCRQWWKKIKRIKMPLRDVRLLIIGWRI